MAHLRILHRGFTGPAALAALMAVFAFSGAGQAGDRPPGQAREGLRLAQEAAFAWAHDAHLAYLENDEPLSESGAAARWGYLFYAPSRDAARGYSVEGGKIVQATDLSVRFEAPPISDSWIDSQAALAAARQALRGNRAGDGPPSTMLLMRGAFDEKEPDRTCGLICYRAPGSPSLFVVVDAGSGSFVRTWKG